MFFISCRRISFSAHSSERTVSNVFIGDGLSHVPGRVHITSIGDDDDFNILYVSRRNINWPSQMSLAMAAWTVAFHNGWILFIRMTGVHSTSGYLSLSMPFLASLLVVFRRHNIFLNTFLKKTYQFSYRPTSMNCSVPNHFTFVFTRPSMSNFNFSISYA